MTEALLRLRGVQKRYGGVRALRGVDLDVLAGEVHAIVGENGAGKSTLIKIVSGAEAADAGTVEIDGAPLHGGNTQEAMEAGIATVYQEPHLFGELTVAENVFLGRELRAAGGWTGRPSAPASASCWRRSASTRRSATSASPTCRWPSSSSCRSPRRSRTRRRC